MDSKTVVDTDSILAMLQSLSIGQGTSNTEEVLNVAYMPASVISRVWNMMFSLKGDDELTKIQSTTELKMKQRKKEIQTLTSLGQVQKMSDLRTLDNPQFIMTHQRGSEKYQNLVPRDTEVLIAQRKSVNFSRNKQKRVNRMVSRIAEDYKDEFGKDHGVVQHHKIMASGYFRKEDGSRLMPIDVLTAKVKANSEPPTIVSVIAHMPFSMKELKKEEVTDLEQVSRDYR